MARKTAVEQRLDDLSKSIDDGFKRMEKALEKHVADDEKQFDDHEARICEQELHRARFDGKTGLIITGLTLLGSSTAAAFVKYLLP